MTHRKLWKWLKELSVLGKTVIINGQPIRELFNLFKQKKSRMGDEEGDDNLLIRSHNILHGFWTKTCNFFKPVTQ